MNKNTLLVGALCAAIFSSCNQKENIKTIIIKNNLDFKRTFETVELSKEFLNVEDLTTLAIKDAETGTLQITQTVDNDGDGTFDDLLFQPQIERNTTKTYHLITITEAEKLKADNLCYSRFVPERTDDYTWENNKVAFRVYGPVAQKMVENSIPGGTLSSGVDAWLKKVEYPIINNWYKKNSKRPGAYHEPSPEGLDNFHVGSSRGVGGIAIKEDTMYHISKNFTKWKTITTGPIRTSFYLEYETWQAGNKNIKESKLISLDLGNNLSKFTTFIEGTNTISAGLTLHEKDGEVTGNTERGWVSYWEPHGDSEIGLAIVAPEHTFIDFETYNTEATDLSNAYAHLKVHNNKVVYYAGFGWKESGQFTTSQAWKNYLNKFSQQINTPLEVSLKN
ncbi:DUF4861 family protein [Neotamlana laminarinivorans]|uniref:DUF4861 domain-containing protein n=1 Tax=Neotamlana laminarinivorans TaxID=2883124 RepID=A0A9X1L4Z6_9FLAO|nr:DUF4861 family protein [Tamlana laminarinivorans]MCB4798821.1 DUF4861 domain-containing protein [Tamlana laminarinivorans]